MIEFVGLPLFLDNHIRGCHGNRAFSHSLCQNCFKDDLVSYLGGPNEEFGVQGNLNWTPG